VDPAGTTIYGAASYGGSDGYGVVYSLARSARGHWLEKVLHSFPGGIGGGNPTFGLSSDAAGNLYGIATNPTRKLSLVYQVAKNSEGKWTERAIYQFGFPRSSNNGAEGNLFVDRAGNAFGLGGGGSAGDGNIYELTQSAGKWTESLLYSFAGGADGVDPVGSPIMDINGNLYGVTAHGGRTGCFGVGCGTLFEFTP
jgi:hypothetical protein